MSLENNDKEKEDYDENVKKWLEKLELRQIEEVSIFPNASIFQRNIYTFGEKEEVYLKYSAINSDIESYDELAYLESKPCIYKISDDIFISVLGKEASACQILELPMNEDGVRGTITIIGVYSDRCVTRNKLRSYDVTIKKFENFNVVPLNEIYDKGSVKAEDFLEQATYRLNRGQFERYLRHVREGRVVNEP